MVRVAALLLAAAVPLCAQSWDALRALKAGDRIRVQEMDGTRHDGAFVALTDTSISVRTKQSEVAVERSRTQRVQVRSGARRARNLAIGAGIGVAVGLVVDNTLGQYLRNESGENSGARAVTYIAPIGLFGALGGAFPAYRTIYKK